MAQLVDTVWQLIGTFASLWVLAALVIMTLAFWFGWFLPKGRYFAEVGAQTFDSRPGGFRPSEAGDILSKFGDRLAVYEFQARVVDMIFPVVYSVMAAVWIRLAAPNLTDLRWLILLPFTMAIFDWLENLFVATTIKRFRTTPANLGSAPTWLLVAQRIKWLHLGALVVILLIVTIGWIRRASA